MPEVILHLNSLAALRAELPNLEKRRSFVPGAEGVTMRQACVLVLVHPEAGTRLSLPAEVVWVQAEGPAKGVGVELREVNVERLRAFVETGIGEPAAAVIAPDLAEPVESKDEPSPGEPERAPGLHDKVRGFSAREREACARSGALTERVALERCYGSTVWEGLLQHPQLTPPEVARIARNGTISAPLIAQIVANAAWLSIGEIQRALLSNPRVSGPQIGRVLRALPQSELRRVAQQTAYAASVRQAAQKLLKA